MDRMKLWETKFFLKYLQIEEIRHSLFIIVN